MSSTPVLVDDEASSTDKIMELRSPDVYSLDIEGKVVDDAHLRNNTVENFVWEGITVTVKDRVTKQPKAILDHVDGYVRKGELCALMGPSGCGKTTLLNVLARRDNSGARLEGTTLINGTSPPIASFRQLTSYVEQEDALIGSLTVKETMKFAAKLTNTPGVSGKERMRRIDSLLDSFGLRKQENLLVGTPIRKGISGGQKRRLSVASQLVTSPKVLFLDEPTSGLDSAASLEVVTFIRNVAKQNNLIVIASIHQPSTTTFQLFDKLLLLSGGKSHYFGRVAGVETYFASLSMPIPLYTNPAEFVLDLMNTDFSGDPITSAQQLAFLHRSWTSSRHARGLSDEIIRAVNSRRDAEKLTDHLKRKNFFSVTFHLVHRQFIKSYRDVVAYGIRLAMYTGLAIMSGTVWLRLTSNQTDIQPYINSIFFGSAFMSFMAVAYVPSFLEDRHNFVKERANGLYGATAFQVSNFIIGLPYLFIISVVFSSISYWLTAFQPRAKEFLTFIMWLFLDLVAAESMVVFISSLIPNFVVALALTAFANGLWMCVGGFFVPTTILNVFWRYTFHYIDYQTYVFQGMMVNEFQFRSYDCDAQCHCMYQTNLAPICKISGKGILKQYDYPTDQNIQWIGILLGIVLGYRLLGWGVLVLRK